MPIKINGTMVIDEANFADKNLSNLSEAGLAVITNAASSAIGSSNMLGRANFSAAVSFSLQGGQTYTAPSKGYFWIRTVTSGATATINDATIAVGTSAGESQFINAFLPVSQGDVIKSTGGQAYFVQGLFVPQI